MNSGRLEPTRLLETRHSRSRVGVDNVKVGVPQNFVRAKRTRSLHNPRSATVVNKLFTKRTFSYTSFHDYKSN